MSTQEHSLAQQQRDDAHSAAAADRLVEEFSGDLRDAPHVVPASGDKFLAVLPSAPIVLPPPPKQRLAEPRGPAHACLFVAGE